MNKAVFLDRDGTINKEVQYLDDAEKLELLPNVAKVIKILNEGGFKVIVITNQSAIARGLLTREKLEEIHNKLSKLLSDEGSKIDAIYYCPHHPDENCECRKPRTGLILKASKEYNISLKDSYMIGDKLVDVETGKNAGCKTILVLTGYGTEEKQKMKTSCRPDFVARNLCDAVSRFICNDQRLPKIPRNEDALLLGGHRKPHVRKDSIRKSHHQRYMSVLTFYDIRRG